MGRINLFLPVQTLLRCKQASSQPNHAKTNHPTASVQAAVRVGSGGDRLPVNDVSRSGSLRQALQWFEGLEWVVRLPSLPSILWPLPQLPSHSV